MRARDTQLINHAVVRCRQPWMLSGAGDRCLGNCSVQFSAVLSISAGTASLYSLCHMGSSMREDLFEKREKERPFINSFPKYKLRVDWAKARIQEPSPGHPQGWQGIQVLEPSPTTSQVAHQQEIRGGGRVRT